MYFPPPPATVYGGDGWRERERVDTVLYNVTTNTVCLHNSGGEILNQLEISQKDDDDGD